jgi:hypothetical protein
MAGRGWHNGGGAARIDFFTPDSGMKTRVARQRLLRNTGRQRFVHVFTLSSRLVCRSAASDEDANGY